MTSYEACAIIEGFDDAVHTEQDVVDAVQHLINTGEVWQLQGSYGRLAKCLIEAGLCSTRKTS